jgi:phage tail sheath protein FI
MPTQVTYPGVYIEEVPSGVRAITGVSTSVAAFLGTSKRGPINKATHILSYADYERRFGGLAADSEMSYAVRQFFLNGGSDAWVVRLAKNAVAATCPLQDGAGRDVLRLTALDEGKTGNQIEVRVSYRFASNPASTFNLTLNYVPRENPTESLTENLSSLSMNSQDARYVQDAVNGTSQLVKVERIVDSATLSGLGSGTSVSGDLSEGGALKDVATLLDAAHNRIQISVNGSPPVEVELDLAAIGAGADAAARLTNLCSDIQRKVRAEADGEQALSGFQCAPDRNTIKMTSGAAGENSTVRVLPGQTNDASTRLKLGTLNGGVETDAVADIRPVEVPAHGTLTSGTFQATDLDTLPSASKNSFQISLDGYGPDTVSLGSSAASGADLAAKLQDVAARIQGTVGALKPSNPAYRDFTCVANTTPGRPDTNTLTLASGTRGTASSVTVNAAANNSIANELHLLTGASVHRATNVMLQGGSESPFTESEAYNIFIADRSQRKGIYALEEIDLFNLLCMPGVTDSGILADAAAYCQERRAFLIVDAPSNARKPDDMVKVVSGTALPKTDHAAVYYPWIKVADPLNNGKLRTCAPSGLVAGLYARTDSFSGVWKAPAGTPANLLGAQGVEYPLTDGENGMLNPLGVNCIRVFPIYGVVSWGARTLRGADQMTSEWKYVPVRRLALFIEESLYRGTKWAVFEPNDAPLWRQIGSNVGAFMQSLFRQGAFQGGTPSEAYFVKCDNETTTQNDIDRGIVNVLVGFAPLKPAEFVVLKIQQMAGQAEA